MSAGTAPTSRITAASFGNMPTTRAALALLVYLLQRIGRPDFRPMRPRKCAERQNLCLRLVHQRTDLGEPADQLITNLVPRGGGGGGIGLGEVSGIRNGTSLAWVATNRGLTPLRSVVRASVRS